MTRRRTTAIVAGSVAVVVVAALGAGVWAVTGAMDSSFRFGGGVAAASTPTGTATGTATATPTPLPDASVVAVGGVLDAEAALELRREMPESGDFAYQLPDGRWIKTNRLQPMPPEVMAVEQAKADAVPLPAGTSIEDWKTVRKNGTSARGSYSYATGRNVVIVLQGIQGCGGANCVMWQMEAPLGLLDKLPIGGNGFDTAEDAVAESQQLIATMPDAPTWDIVVAHQH